MRSKAHVIFDIQTEKFKYLHRAENKVKNTVDIDVLNKRLSRIKRLNIYSNAKMIVFSLVVLLLFALLSASF
jgi:hypothetical protein